MWSNLIIYEIFYTALPILPSAFPSNVRNIWSANSVASPFGKKLWYMFSNCGLEIKPSGYSLMNFWYHFSSSFSLNFVRFKRCMSWWGSILLCFLPILRQAWANGQEDHAKPKRNTTDINLRCLIRVSMTTVYILSFEMFVDTPTVFLDDKSEVYVDVLDVVPHYYRRTTV